MILILYSLFFLCFIPLSAFFTGVVAVKAPNQFKRILPLFILTASMLAYCVEPKVEVDLTRYFDQLNRCYQLPLKEAFTWGEDGLMVKNFIFWLVSKTGDYHLLAALSTGTVFGVLGYILCDNREFDRKALWKVLLLTLLLLPFFNIVSNVRNVSAFSLIILAVYWDVVKKKRNIITLLMYILPCFIHITGFFMVAMRLLIPFSRKHRNTVLVLTAGFPVLVIGAYERYGNITFSGNVGIIIRKGLGKAYSSVMSNSDYAIRMQSSGSFQSRRFLMFGAMIILMLLTLDYLKKNDNELCEFVGFCFLFCEISMVWIVLGAVKYWVFAFGTVISSIPILFYYIKNYQKLAFGYKMMILGLSWIAVMNFGIELYYMGERISFAEYGVSILLNNPVCTFFKICSNLYKFALFAK